MGSRSRTVGKVFEVRLSGEMAQLAGGHSTGYVAVDETTDPQGRAHLPYTAEPYLTGGRAIDNRADYEHVQRQAYGGTIYGDRGGAEQAMASRQAQHLLFRQVRQRERR